MKKSSIFSILIIGLGFASLASAQIQLPNPLGNVNDFATLLNNIANYVTGIIGLLAIIMFLWAGILFLTSAGNEQRITSAKKAVFYAIIGLAIALSGAGLIALVQVIITGNV
ncbi:MAG: hypothetical protein A3D35_01820 [Candidatus Staskawiczbacteria bacterium RIFCSPHIGHO2_02_FULL_34_9]|uniref:Uncharacterized protein n=1 Tax=Candidatus Staskawiczbacteria bacterium RIFCSPHIGHO2_02_FULL_34_9 TaxID=1802206 RepID=A0A1G2HWX9_9BACT|nr:MAG: hypothetical protein A3D35_01820 [Candidatus Staskawiczbacteria bacterium RIFCSPHIGHO2_02_FULL_34_9]